LENKKKAIVAGHICLDMTPVFPEQKAEHLEEILQPGKLIHMNGVDVHTGGAVANTGLAMKILGNDVSLMGKIGNDYFGKMALEILKDYDAEQDMIVSETSATSYSVVLAVPGIDRVFLHDPGANDTFCAEDLNWEKVQQADLFHFGYPTLMKQMYRNHGEKMLEILQRVKSYGVAVSLDMAAVDEASEAGQADWEEILGKVLPYVDFFVPSAEELCFMIDRKRYHEWKQKAAGRDMTEILHMQDVHPLGEKVLSLGAKAVLIKCGAPGIYYKTAEREQMRKLCDRLDLNIDEWSDKEGFEESYKPEKVLSGTGAGDTSIAAFLTSVLRGEPLAEALQMAAATGACCVAAYDALGGLQPLEVLKEKIANGWSKNRSL
jgi:sugar/nucleoside kinase (ribokinase family)